MDCRQYYVCVSERVYVSWQSIGQQEGLSLDEDIAQLLVSFYLSVKESDREKLGVCCVHCQSPLSIYCPSCHLPPPPHPSLPSSSSLSSSSVPLSASTSLLLSRLSSSTQSLSLSLPPLSTLSSDACVSCMSVTATTGVPPHFNVTSATTGVQPHHAVTSATTGGLPRHSVTSSTTIVQPYHAVTSATTGVPPHDTVTSVTTGVKPHDTVTSATTGVPPHDTETSATTGEQPYHAVTSVTTGVPPHDTETSATTGVQPHDTETSVTTGVQPHHAVTSVTTGQADPDIKTEDETFGLTQNGVSDSNDCLFEVDLVKMESSVSTSDSSLKSRKLEMCLVPSTAALRKSLRIMTRKQPTRISQRVRRKTTRDTKRTQSKKTTKNEHIDKNTTVSDSDIEMEDMEREDDCRDSAKTRLDKRKITNDKNDNHKNTTVSDSDTEMENMDDCRDSAEARLNKRPGKVEREDTGRVTHTNNKPQQRKRRPCSSQDLDKGQVIPEDERRLAQVHVYDDAYFQRYQIVDKYPKHPARQKRYGRQIVTAKNVAINSEKERCDVVCVTDSESALSGREEMDCYGHDTASTGQNNGVALTSHVHRNKINQHLTDKDGNLGDGESLSQQTQSGRADDLEQEPCFRILVSAQKILPLCTSSGHCANNFYSHFECAHCKMAFVHKRAFNSHVQEHIERRVYKCCHCERCFENPCAKITHEKRHKYACEVCGYKYLQYTMIKEHMKLHTRNNDVMKCPGCPFQTSDFDTYKKHKAHCLVLQCEVCGVQLKSRKALSFHMAAIHRNERPFKCELCDKSFVLKTKLNSHIKYRHADGGRLFHCDKCTYRAFDAPSLKHHHRSMHSNERPFKCPHCPSAFAQKSTLMVHLRRHTGEKPFRCSECLQTFAQKTSLTRHIRSQHSEVV